MLCRNFLFKRQFLDALAQVAERDQFCAEDMRLAVFLGLSNIE
jgi:hypothetical protein